jgi:L-ascorbate metabolism protein UlaG (beta-lactamase superfamily)
MVVVLFIIVAVPLIAIIVAALISGPAYDGPVSDHFDGKKFINPGGADQQGLTSVLKWLVNRKQGPWKEVKTDSYGIRPLLREKETVRITFVNHSTLLIQVDGLNILTDPIWSSRTGPFTWVGPKRMRPPGIRFEDLPRIDVVLISHNHYDHLDLPTMRTIFGSFHPKIFTPLGVKALLDSEKISGATDMDWWEEANLNDSVKLTSVPAQHFSARGMLDRNATLWCGYVLKTSKGNIYFAGDTGYNENTFKDIGLRCGAMKVAMIPIGAYRPEWFMAPVHTSPDEAVKVHLDVKAEVSVAIHTGTFALGDEGQLDAAKDLQLALSRYDVNPSHFRVLNEGEVLVIE